MIKLLNKNKESWKNIKNKIIVLFWFFSSSKHLFNSKFIYLITTTRNIFYFK